MTVELNPVSSGYSTGLINDNFQAIEDYINNSLLNRANLEVGETNQMELTIDMNSNRIINLPLPVEDSEAVRLQDLRAAMEGGSADIVSFTPYGYVSASTVQSAIEQVVDQTDDLTAAGIGFTPYSYATGTDVQAAVQQVVDKTESLTEADVSHTSYGYATAATVGGALQQIVDETTDTPASDIVFTPYGHISSTNTQAAIEEFVDSVGESSVTTSTGTQTLLAALDDPARLATGRVSVIPEDFGAVGDGVADDTTALNNFFAACEDAIGEVEDSSKVYRYTGTLTIPANATIRFNGAFLELDFSPAASTATITTGANTVVDHMRITVPTGNTVDRVIDIGADNRILKLEIDSVDQQPNAGLNAAVRIIGDRAVVDDLYVENFDRAFIIDSHDVTVRYPKVVSYVRGVYIVDSQRATLTSPRFRVASPNALYQAGHNAILVESTSSNATRDLHISHPKVENAGEHGIRFGGQFTISRATIDSPIIYNVGGSGIKILGAAGEFHQRIQINSPLVMDCGQDAGNKSGILIQRVEGCTITSPVIRRIVKTFSCYDGVRFTNVNDCMVSSPSIEDCANSGIELDAGGLGDSNNVTVDGGSIINCANFGVRWNIGGVNFRRISIKGSPLIEGCGQAVEMSVTTGSVTRGYFSAEMYFNTSIGTGLGVVAAELIGDFDGAIIFRNGSTWLDYDGQVFRVRKSGTWTAI